MSTLDELAYYCKLNNPVGALLLTGEWGCGKTYIVENDLKELLKDTHVIIRVSFFGIPTIEELHKTVKASWIHAKGGFAEKATKAGKFGEFINKAKELIPNDIAKSAVGAVLSINLSDFIKIENQINEKKVVLVFDDLERSKLTTEEKLGAINEYCENQHFNVVIVADENRLNDKAYDDFKEKVVQRTVHHVPNYESIVSSVIADISNLHYKAFLEKWAKEITALFAGVDLEGNSLDKQAAEKLERYVSIRDKDREKAKEQKKELIKKRPHNIRSLKSAIQNFERIYTILTKRNIEDDYKWLFSFLSFNLAAKANLVHKHERYGMIFGNQDMDLLYPGFFDPRFLPEVLSNWILDGSYNEDALNSYIDEHYKDAEDLRPKNQVKNKRIDYLEENVAIQGMHDILPDAYNGSLGLNEYVTFICNSKLSRQYDLLHLDVDWNRVQAGIKNRIEESIAKGEKIELHTISISDLNDYTDEEKAAYSIIKSARDSSYTMYEANRREYVHAMRNTPYEAFIHVSSKRYNCFDEEMAEATIDAYKVVDNPTKAQFPGYFEGMWQNYRHSFDVGKEGVEKSRAGFSKLKEELEKLCEGYSDQPFKKRFTEAFISVIDKLLESEGEPSEDQDDE